MTGQQGSQGQNGMVQGNTAVKVVQNEFTAANNLIVLLWIDAAGSWTGNINIDEHWRCKKKEAELLTSF